MTAPSRQGGYSRDVRNGFETTVQGAGARYGENHGMGDFVERADGKVLVCYTSRPSGNRKVMLSVVDTLAYFLATENSAKANESVFYTLANTIDGGDLARCFFLKIPRSDPEDLTEPDPILLFIYDFDWDGLDVPGNHIVKVYRSLSGLGDDFTLLATPATAAHLGKTLSYLRAGISPPVRLSSGRIVVCFMAEETGTIYDRMKPHFVYSDDRGVSWSAVIKPEGGTDLSGYWERPGGMAVSGNQIAVLVSNTYGVGFVLYTISENGGESWTPLTGAGSLPTGDYVNSHVAMGRYYDDHLPDGFNYLAITPPGDGSLYRRRNDSPIEHAAPSMAGWEGPLNNTIGTDDYNSYINTIRDESDRDDPTHVISQTSHSGGGSIFMINVVKEFKVAIVAIADDVIRSTFPLIRMFIVFQHRLNGSDHLEFKLQSSLETITSYDDGDGHYVAGRFGYSMDGGSKFINWPAGGVPATNPYGLMVAANIAVPPGRSATLKPSVRIFEGSGAGEWWDLDFGERSTWWDLGLNFGETAEQWEPSFEHEVTGLP